MIDEPEQFPGFSVAINVTRHPRYLPITSRPPLDMQCKFRLNPPSQSDNSPDGIRQTNNQSIAGIPQRMPLLHRFPSPFADDAGRATKIVFIESDALFW